MKYLYVVGVFAFMNGCSGYDNSSAANKPTNGDRSYVADIQNPSLHLFPTNLGEQSKKTTIEIAGFFLDIIYDATIKKIELPQAIQVPLKIRNFERMLSIYGLERLREICVDMNYRSQRMQVITKIRGSIRINPFTNRAILEEFRRRVPNHGDDSVPGSMLPITTRVNIEAPFFNDRELLKLQSKFESILNSSRESLDFDWLGDLSRLENEDQDEPIMELGRLICGILGGEANITFVLTDSDGRVLTVKVDKVEM